MSQNIYKNTKNANIIILLMLLMGLGPFSFEIYVPALHSISQYYNVSLYSVQLTITLFPLGYGISQLFLGPFSDHYGRKKILHLGLSIYFLASLGCLFSKHVNMLIGFRILQSVGACACPVLVRALVIDYFDEKKTVKVLATMGAIMGFAPAVSPIIGNFIILHANWQSLFFIMALYSFLLIGLVSIFFKKDQVNLNYSAFSLKNTINMFVIMLKSKYFVLNSLIIIMFYSGLLSFISLTPVLFKEILNIEDKNFGYFFGFIISFYALGSLVSSKLTNILSFKWIKYFSLTLANVAGIILLIVHLLNAYLIFNIVIAAIFFAFATGIILPIGTAKILSNYKEKAGIASGLLGFIQMSVTSFVGTVINYLFLRNSVFLGICFVSISFAGYALMFFLYKEEKVPTI